MSEETPVFNEYFFGKVAAHAYWEEKQKITSGYEKIAVSMPSSDPGTPIKADYPLTTPKPAPAVPYKKKGKGAVPAAMGYGKPGGMHLKKITSKTSAWNVPK